MRAFWTVVLVAVIATGSVRVRHRHERGPATMSAQLAGHHHHVRSHRAPAVLVGAIALPVASREVLALVDAPRPDAPEAERATPLARGPPHG